MKQTLSKWLSILLPLLLGVFLIIYTYNQFSPEQIKKIQHHFENANYSYIYLSLLLSLISYISRAYRWKYSLNHLGYPNSFHNNFMAVSIGYLMNMTIPRSGEVTRAVILKKYDNIPFDKGFGTIVAERIVDSFILLLCICTALIFQFEVVKAFVIDKIPKQKIAWLLAIGFILFIIALLFYYYSKLKIVLLIKEKISGLKEGLLSIFKMKKKWGFLLHTIIIWVSYILMFYVTIYALPETSHIGIGAVITSFVVGSIAIALTSSGFGTYPVLMSKILLFYSVAETAGSAFGWIVWTSQMLMTVFLGCLSFLLLPLFNKNK